MHTQDHGDQTFLHNGDYSGDVTITGLHWSFDEAGQSYTATIPFAALASFVAEAVRDARTSRLEEMEPWALLGLPELRQDFRELT